MQEHLQEKDARVIGAEEGATLDATASKARLTRTRALAGAAVIAAAVTIPDISAGAMDSPLMRFELGEPRSSLPPPVWSPSVGANAPVYAPAMAAEEIAPASITFGSAPRLALAERMQPLAFLASGSERFDLAFAGVALPRPASIPVSAGLANQPAGEFRGRAPALRRRQIDVPQISETLAFVPQIGRYEQPEDSASAAGAADRSAPISNQGNDSVAMADDAVEAAFAGELDVSGGASDAIRRALPISSSVDAQGTLPVEVDTARAVPIPAPDPGLVSSRAAQIELVQKTELGARINGVLTGSVDFQQRDGTIAVRLGSVVDLLRERYASAEIDRIAGSGALGTYVTLAQLQAAGVPISYNPAYDEVEFGIDYDDAPEAAKVQVEQIGAPTLGTDRVGIDQIPR